MKSFFVLAMPGGWELIIIALVVLLFFGAKRIPEIFRGFGKGIQEFKQASKEIQKEIEDDDTKDKK